MRPLAILAVGTALAAAPLVAQDDMRDVITLKSGQVMRGRVLDRYEPDDLLIMQGGKRVHVAQKDVQSLDTVLDRLTELMQRRAELQDNLTYRWILAQWAATHDLPAMARLLALDVVLADPTHEAAQEMLGHRKAGDVWLWPLKDRWVPLDELQRYHSDWGHGLELASEHFAIHTNAGLQSTIDALFDLERLYVWWFDRFGERLRLHEVLEPLDVQIWRDASDFPAWSSLRMPYFRVAVEGPLPLSAASYTYYDNAERPERLFEVATQHLIYATLADSPVLQNVKDRLCAWAEVGFGQWVESGFGGPPGHAEPTAPQLSRAEARLALDRRAYHLENLTHLQARLLYVTVADVTLVHWASVHAFVAYLMADHQPPTREAFLDYLYEAERKAKGDSSTALDEALKRPVQTLADPYEKWLREVVTTGKSN